MVSMLRAVVPIPKQVVAGQAIPLLLAIVAVALGLLAAPVGAQQIGKIPRIGFLSSTPSGISEGFRGG